MLETLIMFLLLAAIVPLALSIFFYITKPGPRWRRVPSRAWLNAVGMQVVAQKSILLVLLSFILISRFLGDFPGRQVIAWVLYTALVAAFWTFFVIQRRIQKPFERKNR
jgi:amino acid transporter